ncbi:MAG: ParB/RepB/Spo0J family partition protein [Nitrososphaerota archaeon]
MSQSITEIDLSEITPNPRQPRTTFDREKLEELANSIRIHGLLEPIVVRKHKKGYQIVCGERRWKAFQILGRPTIPAIIKEVEDENVLVESLIENLHREDLTSIERENAIAELWGSGKYKTHKELADALGYKDPNTVKAILDAYEIRHKYLNDKITAASISTRAITDTAGLEPIERKKVIEKVAKGELDASRIREFVADLKKVPEPIKKAIIEGKINHEDVKPYIEIIKDKPEMAENFVQEFEIRKREKEAYRKAEIERDKAIIKGELKPTVTYHEPTPDEKRFEQFDEVYTKVHYWQWFDITSIKDPEWRRKAVARLKAIRDHIDALLKKLEEI